MKPAMKLFPVLLFALLACNPGNSFADSDGRIVGKIKTQTGEGLLGALVAIYRQQSSENPTAFTRSDRSGSYVLAHLTPGSYLLQVSRAGFSPISTSEIRVEPDKTTSLDVILQEFVDYISNNNDPRNRDVQSVMRSTSDRRLIFRDLQSSLPGESNGQQFSRGGAMMLASGTDARIQNDPLATGRGQTSILSNFAFVEPLSQHGRMIFSGQLSSGYDTFWQVRNTYNYRPSPDRDMRFSLGYGRLMLNESGSDAFGRPFQFFTQDADLRESGIQTLAMGLEGSSKILDFLKMDYGVDVTRIYCGAAKNYVNPSFRLTFSPSDGWFIRTSYTAKRNSEYNSLMLPGGEVVSLSEPVAMARINGETRISQLRHSEISLGKTLSDETSIELALYEDRSVGPGTAFLTARNAVDDSNAQFMQLREDQSAQRGLHLVMSRKLLDFLDGSVTYGYGTGTRAVGPGESVPADVVVQNLLSYMQRSYYHTFTSQLGARLPLTKTNLTTVVKWYPGDPITPIDLFADHLDLMTKGVSLIIRQVFPVPEFMGNGRWEASVDLRNLFDQGFDHIRTRDGDLILMRNPRSLRFGLNLSFF